jgi:molybdate transport system substrate-binding protein
VRFERWSARRALLLVLVLASLVSCGGRSTPAAERAPSTMRSTEGENAQLVVFAASSLLGPFEQLGEAFRSRHPSVAVSYNFAGSAQLVAQLEQGALADVAAFADLDNMRRAQAAGLIRGEPVVFARNRLALVVPASNPAGIERLADLARPGVKVVLAHENVPAGRYARTMLTRASQRPDYGPDFAQRVLANVVSQEVNVKQVLAKVALGEADVGIVYVTDIEAAGPSVRALEIPSELNVIACYPIAVAAASQQPALADEFIALVRSETGQQLLAQYGFEPVSRNLSEPGSCG